MFKGIPQQFNAILTNSNFERMHLLYCDQEKKEFFLAIILLVFYDFIQYVQRNKTIPEFINSRSTGIRWGLYFVFLYSIIFLGVFEKIQFIYFQF
jgi:hypothetical protein